MAFIPNLFERINLLRLYKHTTSVPVMTLCPVHGDSERHPNLAVYPHNAYCYNGECHYTEGALQHIERVCGCKTRKEIFAVVEAILEDRPVTITEAALPPLDESLPSTYHAYLARSIERRRFLYERYGLRRETTEAALLGHTDRTAYTLPVFDQAGNLVTIRFRADDTKASVTCPTCSYAQTGYIATCPKCSGEMKRDSEKYWALRRRGQTTIYLPPIFRGEGTLADTVIAATGANKLVITEGEFDALAGCQSGVPCVSFTNGAKSVLDGGRKLLDQLKGLSVWVAFDQDAPGQTSGASLVSLLQSLQIPARLVRWDRQLGKDLSELVAHGYTKDDLRSAWTVS